MYTHVAAVTLAAALGANPINLMAPVLGAEEEVEVSVGVGSDSRGVIVVDHNGQRREIEIALDDMEGIGAVMAGIDEAMEQDESGTIGQLIGRFMSGDITPEVRVEAIVEMEDGDGERVRRRINLGGDDGGEIDFDEVIMMMAGDPDDGGWAGHWQMAAGFPSCGGPGMPGGMWHPGMGGPGGRGPGMCQPGVCAQGGGDMLRQHMHFMHEMHENPEAVWEMIERLPPEMRREHEEMLAAMGGGHDHDGDEFMRQTEQFAVKLQMCKEVAARLGDGEAMAIFGVWQAREHMAPENRIALLEPIVYDEDLLRSVRNAAAWVVMEAQAEIGEAEAGAATLQQIIRANGTR